MIIAECVFYVCLCITCFYFLEKLSKIQREPVTWQIVGGIFLVSGAAILALLAMNAYLKILVTYAERFI
jgi:hypothetical protein